MVRVLRKSEAKGEVSGAFLLGLLHSFQNLNVLPNSEAFHEMGRLDPAGWYPYANFIDLLHEIRAEVPRADAILFRAGVHFIRLWYEEGPGKTMIHSGRDWLYANQESAGYNSVVRGGRKEEIGWCVLQEIDEENGFAVYENVMALSPEYVRGVFYGGCQLFDDMDYVDVSVETTGYPSNKEFTRFLVKVRFRLQPCGNNVDLNQAARDALRGTTPDLRQEDGHRLLLRYESMKLQRALDLQYFDELNALLVRANRKSQAAQADLEFLAQHDQLTGLPNRLLFNDRLSQSLIRGQRHGSAFALLFADLDGFKLVNDTLGHDTGDALLVAVGQRLQETVRKADTVARMGGDEFTIILNDIEDEGRIAPVVQKILEALAKPFHLGSSIVRIGASVGTAIYPRDGLDAHGLLSAADLSMYSAKERGRKGRAGQSATNPGAE